MVYLYNCTSHGADMQTTFYGGGIQTASVIVQIYTNCFLWWRYAESVSLWCIYTARISYGGDVQTAPVMVEIHRPYFLWWRRTDCTCDGGDTQTVFLMVETYRLHLWWWRYTDRISYGGHVQTAPVMVEILRPYFLWWRRTDCTCDGGILRPYFSWCPWARHCHEVSRRMQACCAMKLWCPGTRQRRCSMRTDKIAAVKL